MRPISTIVSELQLKISAGFVLVGMLIAAAFLCPETGASAVLGGVASLFLAKLLRSSRRPALHSFLMGVVLHLLGFYWLTDTVTLFGGFPRPLSLVVFALFALSGAVQFLLFGALYRRLAQTRLQQFSLALPLAWFTLEYLFPRLFPWTLGHSQIRWTQLAMMAEFFGVYFISFLLLWWADLFARPRREGMLFPAAALFISCAAVQVVGQLRVDSTERLMEQSPKLDAALVQGNLEVYQKRDIRYLVSNLNTYQQISASAVKRGADLVIWPESVFTEWTPQGIETINGTRYNPYPGLSVSLLYGGLSIRPLAANEFGDPDPEKARRFNTAIGIDPSGKIYGMYHKRVLMPFGEYMPFAERFPFIKELSPMTGDFTAGDLSEPISLPVRLLHPAMPSMEGGAPVENVTEVSVEKQVKIGVLICYEDLVSSLSVDEVLHGAELLVSLSNDAWYGNTAAPEQHHLLALWRAIETKRYLLRATNTGYTAIVNPLGRTEESLPLFTSSYLLQPVGILSEQTVYTRLPSFPAWLLALGVIVIGLRPGLLKGPFRNVAGSSSSTGS